MRTTERQDARAGLAGHKGRHSNALPKPPSAWVVPLQPGQDELECGAGGNRTWGRIEQPMDASMGLPMRPGGGS